MSPDSDGGMSEAEVARTAAIYRRLLTISRIVVIFIAIGVGGAIGAVIAYQTGGDVGGVPRA